MHFLFVFSIFCLCPFCLSIWVFVCVLQDRIHIENGALTVVSVNLSDAGMYQCVAENKHGIIYFSAELVVLGKTVLKTLFLLFFVSSPTSFLFGSFPYHHKLLCVMNLKYAMDSGSLLLRELLLYLREKPILMFLASCTKSKFVYSESIKLKYKNYNIIKALKSIFLYIKKDVLVNVTCPKTLTKFCETIMSYIIILCGWGLKSLQSRWILISKTITS